MPPESAAPRGRLRQFNARPIWYFYVPLADNSETQCLGEVGTGVAGVQPFQAIRCATSGFQDGKRAPPGAPKVGDARRAGPVLGAAEGRPSEPYTSEMRSGHPKCRACDGSADPRDAARAKSAALKLEAADPWLLVGLLTTLQRGRARRLPGRDSVARGSRRTCYWPL